jgi:ketosteroid isomerase-like protein
MSDTEYLAPPKSETAGPNGRTRTLMLTGALIAALVAIGIALAARGSDNKAETDQVRKVDESLRQALVAGDVGTVDRILATGFQLVDPSGDRESRDTYLRAVTSGALEYQRFDAISPVAVRISGDVAVVSYESQLSVSAGADHLEHKAWHTHVYEKQDGQWRQVWSQATAVGGFPPPGS